MPIPYCLGCCNFPLGFEIRKCESPPNFILLIFQDCSVIVGLLNLHLHINFKMGLHCICSIIQGIETTLVSVNR